MGIDIENSSKISLLQAYIILLLAIGILDHVIMIPLLLSASGRDAWISVIAVLLVSPVWIGCLSYIIRDMRGEAFKDWLRRHFGSFLASCLIVIYSSFLWIMGALSLKDTITWALVSYMPQTPVFVLAAATLTGCLFAAYAGIYSIAIVSGILLPFVVLLGDLVMTANFQFKNYRLLFPMLEYGTLPVLKGIPYAAGGFLELMMITLFQHRLSKKPGFKSLMLVSILLAGLTLGPLVGAIALFGPDEAANQRYPAYEQWRMVRLGEYVEHVDFFSIYQWLSGTFVRVSLSLYLLAEIWRVKRRLVLMICAALLMLVATTAPISDMAFLRFLEHFYFPIFCYFIVTMTIIFVLKIWMSKPRRNVS
ncbi:GerAB/ArcD/ProY family transporter [Ferviditalea candida]|uniref:Endospore germination permease n=1 Tax=Ferviditalea candida TaxID=3108399 RepID=A0ABU5ZLU1_9BACL|nr:endospore germination permease [Paenibacillaceae bacterium T2]